MGVSRIRDEVIDWENGEIRMLLVEEKEVKRRFATEMQIVFFSAFKSINIS